MSDNITIDELKKYSEKLNKAELVSTEIDIDTEDFVDIQKEFIEAMEEAEDTGKLSSVKGSIIKFYERLVAWIKETGGISNTSKSDENKSDDNGFDRDVLETKLDKFEWKELKTFVKENNIPDITIKKSSFDNEKDDHIEAILDYMEENYVPPSKDDEKPENGAFDRDEMEKTLEALEWKELKKIVKEQNIPDVTIKKATFDDEKDDHIEAILDFMEKNAKKPGDEEPTGDSFDRDEMEAKLDKLEWKELKKIVKEHNIPDVKIKKSSFDDEKDDHIEAILDFMEKTPPPKKQSSKGGLVRKEGIAVGDVMAIAFGIFKDDEESFDFKDIAKCASKIRTDAGETDSFASCKSYAKMIIGAMEKVGAIKQNKKEKYDFV